MVKHRATCLTQGNSSTPLSLLFQVSISAKLVLNVAIANGRSDVNFIDQNNTQPKPFEDVFHLNAAARHAVLSILKTPQHTYYLLTVFVGSSSSVPDALIHVTLVGQA